VAVVAGGNHSLGRRADGSLWAWGWNASGQLGLGTYDSQNTPTPVSGTGWVALAAGAYHSLGLKADGALHAWGANNYGQLGLGDTTNRNTPKGLALGRVMAWKAVAAGYYHSLAIRATAPCGPGDVMLMVSWAWEIPPTGTSRPGWARPRTGWRWRWETFIAWG